MENLIYWGVFVIIGFYFFKRRKNEKEILDPLTVISLYGRCLEKNEVGPWLIRDASVLPYNKKAILSCILSQIKVETNPERISFLVTGASFLPYFQDNIGEIPVSQFGVDFNLLDIENLSDGETQNLAKKISDSSLSSRWAELQAIIHEEENSISQQISALSTQS